MQRRFGKLTWTVLIVAVAAIALIIIRGRRSETIVLDETSAETLEIVSLLPRDAIPAIDDPQFVSGADADAIYQPDELVLGVEIDGDARAYSIPFLSGHEIVNDEVGGVPIAVTW